MTVSRAARCLRPCDRLSSPPSVMPPHLIIRANDTSHRVIMVYELKLRVMARRGVRRLRPCDRLSSPLLVML